MNKKSILILAAVAVINMATAQTITVTEGKAVFSIGEQNALTTIIYQNTKDEVADKWKSYLKDFKNEKVKFENDEMFGDNILIKDWGNNPVDIYTRFIEDKEAKTVRMSVAYNLGGAYLTSASDAVKYTTAEKMVKDFAVKATKSPIEAKLKEAQKAMSKLESDQKDLEKENKGLHDDIESYKNKISKAEEGIKKNEDNQAKKKAEIETQKNAVEQINAQIEGVN